MPLILSFKIEEQSGLGVSWEVLGNDLRKNGDAEDIDGVEWGGTTMPSGNFVDFFFWQLQEVVLLI